MKFNEYAERAVETAVYPGQGGSAEGITYVALGLTGEAGEVAEKVKKMLRDDGGILTAGRKDAIAKELGDVLWYWTMMCVECGLDPELVAEGNLEKLAERAKRGTLGGSGDDR